MRIGVDEAGRGPCLGPLVVGAFCAPEEDADLLRAIGVRDSKRLTAPRRSEIAANLRSMGADHGWSMTTVELTPQRIDLALAGAGLNHLEVEGFVEAISEVWPSSNAPQVSLDACDVDEARFGGRVANGLRARGLAPAGLASKHGMDDHDLHVGAASILAKTVRDESVQALSAQLGIALGSGYPSDPATKSALPHLLQGPEPHPDLRWSWATIERAWSSLHAGPVPVRTERGSVRQRSLFDPPSS